MQFAAVLRMCLRALLMLGVCLGLGQAATAGALPVLVLGSNVQSYPALGVLGVHIDPTATLTLADARRADYTLVKSPRSGGFSAAAHWYHLRVVRQAQTPTSWVLTLDEPYLDDVRVWIVAPNGHIQAHALGDHVPLDQRPIRTRGFALHLEVGAEAPTDIYVRVQSNSALNFKALLWQPDAFFANESAENLYQGLALGAILFFLLMNLVFGLRLRDCSILAFANYLASLLLFFLGINGFVPMLLTTAPTWLNDAVTGVGVIGGMAAAVFMWDKIFYRRATYPTMHRCYLALALLCVLLLPLSASSYYRTIAPLLFQVGFLYMSSTLVLVALLWYRNRELEFLFYLVAVLINIAGGANQMAMALGWVANNALTENIHQWLSLAQALMMSMGLLIRIGNTQSAQLNLVKEIEMASQRTEEQRRFSAILTHEFRSPLAAIDRSAQMILFNTPGLAEAATQRVHTIRSNIYALSNLVDVFLSTESIRHNPLQLRLEQYVIEDFLTEEIQLMSEATAYRLRFDIDLAGQTWGLDKVFMGMAMRNIIINALRYSPDHSPVTLSANVDDHGLQISVSDCGSGLSAPELAQLGQPYYRATTSNGTQGTGLGYYFSSQIVTAHGGTLVARNADSGGLVVCMRFDAPSPDKMRHED